MCSTPPPTPSHLSAGLSEYFMSDRSSTWYSVTSFSLIREIMFTKIWLSSEWGYPNKIHCIFGSVQLFWYSSKGEFIWKRNLIIILSMVAGVSAIRRLSPIYLLKESDSSRRVMRRPGSYYGMFPPITVVFVILLSVTPSVSFPSLCLWRPSGKVDGKCHCTPRFALFSGEPREQLVCPKLPSLCPSSGLFVWVRFFWPSPKFGPCPVIKQLVHLEVIWRIVLDLDSWFTG